jgi:hypothetical protein
MGVRDILITGVAAKLPGDYAPLTDEEIRRDVQRRPGSVAPGAKVVGAIQAADRASAGQSVHLASLPAGAVPEFRFHKRRRWRFDYAWPRYRVALEVEGGVWSGGRHVRGKGFLGDMEKYNAAVIGGWRILRVTPQQLADGTADRLVRKAIGGRDGDYRH